MERVRYVSPHAEYGLWLKSSKREFVNGRWDFDPGIHVQFHDGRYETANPEIIKLMDGLLNGPRAAKWRNWFAKVPTQKEIEDITKEVEKGEEERKKALEALPKEKRDKFKNFNEFMKKQKENPAVANALAGMRGITK